MKHAFFGAAIVTAVATGPLWTVVAIAGLVTAYYRVAL
jgi:hypothetical protein